MRDPKPDFWTHSSQPFELGLAVRLLWTALIMPCTAWLLTMLSIGQGELEPTVADGLFGFALALHAGLTVSLARGENWARLSLLAYIVLLLSTLAFGPSLHAGGTAIEAEIVIAYAWILAGALVCLVSDPVSRWFSYRQDRAGLR